LPVIGVLHPGSSAGWAPLIAAFEQGLKETGFAANDNVAIEHHWAENQADRLPRLAADLVRKQVAVIVTISDLPTFAAKAATTTIPILFTVAEDPVKLGLVTSLARPDGNLTGVNIFTSEVIAKRLELLRLLVPGATRVAVLVNPSYVANTEIAIQQGQAAARAMDLQIQFLHANTASEIDAAFETVVRERLDALFIDLVPFFTGRRIQFANLALRHAVPVIYGQRQFVEAGGLVSYGPNLAEAWRQSGLYAGRVLKGAKLAELPVVQASKFELVINAKTAKLLGISVPDKLIALADEVIE
jgi:putative ABC transport system substrate-binding protein